MSEPRGHGQWLAGGTQLRSQFAPGDDLAGADPDPRLELNRTLALQLLLQISEAVSDLDGGADAPEGVILMHDRQPKDGSNCVACDRLDGAAVTVDGGLDLGEHAAGDVPQRFRVDRPTLNGEDPDSREEGGDCFSRFTGEGRRKHPRIRRSLGGLGLASFCLRRQVERRILVQDPLMQLA